MRRHIFGKIISIVHISLIASEKHSGKKECQRNLCYSNIQSAKKRETLLGKFRVEDKSNKQILLI